MEAARKGDVLQAGAPSSSSSSSSFSSCVDVSLQRNAHAGETCEANVVQEPSALSSGILPPSVKWLQRFMSTYFLCDVCQNIVSDPVQTLPVVKMMCRACAISHQVPDGTMAELPLGVVRALEEMQETCASYQQNNVFNAPDATAPTRAADNLIAGRRIVRVKRNGVGRAAANTAKNVASHVSADFVKAAEGNVLQKQLRGFNENESSRRVAIDAMETKERSDLLKKHLTSLRSIQSRNRDSSKALKTEADAKYEEAEYTMALELYSKAIELQPFDRLTRLVTLHGNRSSAYFMAQRYDDCISDCLKVISMEPGNIRMYSRAAKAASIMGDLARAVAQIESIPEALMTDSLHAEKKKYRCGLELYQRAERAFGTSEGDDIWLMLVAQFSDVIPFRLRYAESLFKQKRFLKAVEALEVVSASRRSPRLCHMLANCLYLSGFEHFEKARFCLADVQQLDESCAKLLKLINVVDEGKQKGNQLFQQKKFALAVDHYTTAINAADNNDQILRILYCNRAAAHKELGRYREGIDDCTKAIQLDPEFSKAYARRARCEQLLNDFSAALRDFKSAIQYDPNDHELVREMRNCEHNLAKESEREKDYYYVLGLNRHCTEREIKLKYRELSLRWHPDKCISLPEEERVHAERKFKIIGEAHTTLIDPVKRREYDLKLERERMTRSSGLSRFGTFSGDTFRGQASRYRSGTGGFW